jgi:hypothetical protein
MMKSVYTCDGCRKQVELEAHAVPSPPAPAPPWWLEFYTVRALGPRPPMGQPLATDMTSEHFCSVECLIAAARERFAGLLADALEHAGGDPLEHAILSGVRIERKQLESPVFPRTKP